MLSVTLQRAWVLLDGVSKRCYNRDIAKRNSMKKMDIIANQLRDLMQEVAEEMNATSDENAEQIMALDDATFAIQTAIDLLESV